MSFRARFEQRCEGAAAALRGEVRYNATLPLQLTAPSTVTASENQFFSFEVSAVVQGGGLAALSAFNLPFGANFVDHHDNTATFSWTPLSSQAGAYLIAIQGTYGAVIETTYVRITVRLTPPPNDEFESPVIVTGLPFTHTQKAAAATTASDDPFCYSSTATVWFAYTPLVAGRVEFNTSGSDFLNTLSAYTATRGNLTPIACAYGGTLSRIRFDVTPGVATTSWSVRHHGRAPGNLTLNALEAPPPLSMQLTFNPFSGIDASSGMVTVKGTVICSAASFAFVNGSIRQQRAGHEVLGYFGAYVACDGVTAWQAPVTYLTSGTFNGRAAALFAAGKADVTADVFAYDPTEGTYVSRNAAASIRLHGGQ